MNRFDMAAVIAAVIAVVMVAALAGCTGAIMDPASPSLDPTPGADGDHHDGDGLTPVGTTSGDPTASGLASDPHRPRRRMDLDQLDASVRRVTGGLGWTYTRSGTERSHFTDLASTLGKPDWVQITDEDLEPSALFQKFLDDMARDVCTRLATADAARPAGERRLLVHVEPTDTAATAPAAVDETLSALLLAYHGRAVATSSSELDPWRELFTTASTVEASPVLGWRAVCVGLIVHPDFYSY